MHLNKVSLSGFKSIYNTSIDFDDGLNIIIGKNASGKTNFLSFLNNILDFSFDNIFSFEASLLFKNGKSLKLDIKKNLNKNELKNLIEENIEIKFDKKK